MATTKRIPLFEIDCNKDDIDAVNYVMNSKSSWAKGSVINEFENALAKYLGRKYCLVTNSGCSAIELAMSVVDYSGWIFHVSPFTYHGVFELLDAMKLPYSLTGIETETYSWDEDYFWGMLTHISGFPATKADDVLIEDACQGFGAEKDGRKVGTFGEISVLSFCQNKLITTGEGGAIVTDNPSYYGQMKVLREYNKRMPSMNAALGLSQLNRIDELIAKRRAMAEILKPVYPCALKEIEGHFQTYQMYLVKPDVKVPDHVETKMRFDRCELLKEIPLSLSREVVAQSEVK